MPIPPPRPLLKILRRGEGVPSRPAGNVIDKQAVVGGVGTAKRKDNPKTASWRRSSVWTTSRGGA